ncbi:hypothetical protein CBL_05161 [Carabus blaptoides fortunei]
MNDTGRQMDIHDGFQYQRPATKRARNSTPNPGDLNDSFNSMKSTSQVSSIPEPHHARRILYTAVIGNVPKDYRPPRGLAPFIHQVSNIEITNMLSTRSGVVLIKSPDPHLAKRLQFLTSEQRTPSFSCVITNVDHGVTTDEIQQQLTENGHIIQKLWRIKSRAINSDSRLIRIITTSEGSLDHLLSTVLQSYTNTTA